MNQMYCVYCSFNFLNSASLIQIVQPTTDGGYEVIEEVTRRGYQTIREVAERQESLPDSFLRINQNTVKSSMRAETMVAGNAVCMDHMYEAVESAKTNRRL